MVLYVRGEIKKFSAWPSSDQNKIKRVFASYSSKAQNTTCTIWLLGYTYFVHFSVWTKCLSDGVENANTRTAHKFLKNFRTIPTWPSENLFHNSLFRKKCGSTTLFLRQNNKVCNGTNELTKIVISLHCVTPLFSISTANNRRPLKCTNIYSPKVILCMSCSKPCYYKKQILY